MTVFNGGPFLRDAVEGILQQTFRNFEFLIVDDGSTDGSGEWLRGRAATDSRIRFLENRVNRGQTACLNQALEEARGDWIARQDADDVSHPDRLEALLAAAGDGVAIVGSQGRIIDESGRVTGLIHVPTEDRAIRGTLPFRNPFIHTGVLFRRVGWDGRGFRYDERFRICQDWELWARVIETGRGANVARRLVDYRHRPGSLSHAAAERTQSEAREIASRIWNRQLPGVEAVESLLGPLRVGGVPGDPSGFWRRYRRSLPRAARAVLRLQMAGGLLAGQPVAALVQVLAAMIDDPACALSVVRDTFQERMWRSSQKTMR
ncbi:MAG: glycosyltransferase [Terrimicrobiaceae bacterium]|nr:glycosyltransferase [Terrimicrobiaceae bacterium]